MRRYKFRWYHPPETGSASEMPRWLVLPGIVLIVAVPLLADPAKQGPVSEVLHLCIVALVLLYIGCLWINIGEGAIQEFFRSHRWLMPLGCVIGAPVLLFEPSVAILIMVFSWLWERIRANWFPG